MEQPKKISHGLQSLGGHPAEACAAQVPWSDTPLLMKKQLEIDHYKFKDNKIYRYICCICVFGKFVYTNIQKYYINDHYTGKCMKIYDNFYQLNIIASRIGHGFSKPNG